MTGDGRNAQPRLSAPGLYPEVLETVRCLAGGERYRLLRQPVPTVTWPGRAGGVPGESWTGHVDWPGSVDRTGEDLSGPLASDSNKLYGIVYCSDVQPGGGGFSVVPESHRLLAEIMADPSQRELKRQAYQQSFGDFPRLGAQQTPR